MKIICIGKGNDPRCLGGVETFERVLGKIFKDQIKFFVYNSEKEYIFEADNVRNIQKPESFKEKLLLKILGKTRYTAYKVKKENPDVVIINKPKDLRMIKGGNFKKVLIQHGALEQYKKGAFKSKKVVELIQRELDYYIFLSDRSRELFLNELKLNEKQGITIRHSSEMELLLGAKTKGKKLIIIARLENSQKRIDLAIKAMKKIPDFTLEIYGDGPDKKMLEELVKQEELEERIFFKGATTKVKEKLDEANVFIMTSDHEGYPITTIEAMMRGLPIVLRNTYESALDIVQNNGILLDEVWDEDKFIDAIYKIYDNYEYYSQNSIEMGKRHTFDVISNKWEAFIENI